MSGSGKSRTLGKNAFEEAHAQAGPTQCKVAGKG